MSSAETLAQVKVLEYKLNSIRDFVRSRLLVEPDNTSLEMVLSIISRYEQVSSEWSLSEPIVPESKMYGGNI